MNNDINLFIPSIVNPRAVRRENGNVSLTQHSVTSRASLSLRRNSGIRKCTQIKDTKVLSSPKNKENYLNIKKIINSDLEITNFSKVQNSILKDLDVNFVNNIHMNNKGTNRDSKSFSAKDITSDSHSNSSFLGINSWCNAQTIPNSKLQKFASPELCDDVPQAESNKTNILKSVTAVKSVVDLCGNASQAETSFLNPVTPVEPAGNLCEHELQTKSDETNILRHDSTSTSIIDLCDYESPTKSDENIYETKPTVTVSFGVNNCKHIDMSTKSNIKRVLMSNNNNDMNVECELVENSITSSSSELDENMNEVATVATNNKLSLAVNIDIKRKKYNDTSENSKVLILKTDAIEKLSHVIVQPPNYKLVKRKFLEKSQIRSNKRKSVIRSINVTCDHYKQKQIDNYFPKVNLDLIGKRTIVGNSDAEDMSSGVAEVVKTDCVQKPIKNKKEYDSPRSARLFSARTELHTRLRDIKSSNSEAQRCTSAQRCISPFGRKESQSSQNSPRKKLESIQFSLPSKTKTNKSSVSRSIPHHKIVAGTHFAVDAFSYGEIPNVKHYFLTHFHSDHYSGLKKTFSKLLFCSKITADLCITRLGVNSKCIHIISIDETLRVEGVEVTALDANHCPGAIMLMFTLPNGKTLLHCGDFRACPAMESYPVFWNKDIHTVYLDTTYCNPRYDFPTQDQSLEMALNLLRQKKLTLEKAGKSFSSVLIVCGTYTIGKEKFFLGIARRADCSVWAFPEKDRVLQAVEGRSFSTTPPQACQLHVLAMRDITYEKLKSYLDSLQGAFNEVVAFKPSGWENGKNSTVEKDNVTIHGIPYSEHSSFSELIRFVKFLKPKQVVPTVDISGGIKAVQKYFPCPLIYKEEMQSQSKLTDYFSIQNRQQVPAVT